MPNWAGLLFYAYDGIHQVWTLVFDNYQACTVPITCKTRWLKSPIYRPWISSFHCKNLKSPWNFWRGTNAKTRAMEAKVIPGLILYATLNAQHGEKVTYMYCTQPTLSYTKYVQSVPQNAAGEIEQRLRTHCILLQQWPKFHCNWAQLVASPLLFMKISPQIAEWGTTGVLIGSSEDFYYFTILINFSRFYTI